MYPPGQSLPQWSYGKCALEGGEGGGCTIYSVPLARLATVSLEYTINCRNVESCPRRNLEFFLYFSYLIVFVDLYNNHSLQCNLPQVIRCMLQREVMHAVIQNWAKACGVDIKSWPNWDLKPQTTAVLAGSYWLSCHDRCTTITSPNSL